MAFMHGKNCEVWFGSVDLSPYFNNADFDVTVDTADTSMFKSTWKSAITGQAHGKADLSGLYDPTSTDLPTSLGVDSKVLTICPAGGLAIADRARLLYVTSKTYAESSSVGGAVAIKWSAMSEAAVGFADVLHILTEDTNSTTGATKTDAAGTTAGWIAHLHVTAVDGGSWVVKIQDATASNFSDGADVTGGAFTAATGATSQRLTSAAGATLNRYVRYVATRTGGAGGDGITFALAYSRNS